MEICVFLKKVKYWGSNFLKKSSYAIFVIAIAVSAVTYSSGYSTVAFLQVCLFFFFKLVTALHTSCVELLVSLEKVPNLQSVPDKFKHLS